ncbi:MAG: 16S rRNA processing protein RimM [Sandaracinaceae bacterium]|nr:16S rRNA processing protein RimM [Sandaracinaceae bacterium]
MPVDKDALVALGVIARPHGIRGEVRVHLFNPDSSLLLDSDQVFLRTKERTWAVDVKRARMDKADAVLMQLEHTDTRNDAETLRGTEVCVPRAALPKVDAGEFYHVDAIGLSVVNEQGKVLGRVEQVVRYPAADCFLVSSDDGLREVPNVDAYIAHVDIDGGRLVVHDIADLDVHKPRKPKS